MCGHGVVASVDKQDITRLPAGDVSKCEGHRAGRGAGEVIPCRHVKRPIVIRDQCTFGRPGEGASTRDDLRAREGVRAAGVDIPGDDGRTRNGVRTREDVPTAKGVGGSR